LIKRRDAVALVAGGLLPGLSGGGVSAAQSPYGGSNPAACLKQAKKKKTKAKRKKAKKRCRAKFG
jgi:hypothetical protein